MTINIGSIIKLAEFFLRTPVEKAELDFADKTRLLAERVASLPEFRDWQASSEALIAVEGWGVTKDPATGAIVTVTPPADPAYVAPARQSPSDFNEHSAT